MYNTKTALAVAFGAIVLTVYFTQQLHAERQAAVQLREHVAQLELQLQGAALRPGGLVRAATTASGAAPVADQAAASPADSEANVGPGRRMLALIYPDVEQELGLSESEAEAFGKLLASNSAGSDTMQALLGSRYQQFQQYQKTVEARNWTGGLRQMLAGTAYPLSKEQAQQLIAARTAEHEGRNEDLRLRNRPREPRAWVEYEEESLKILEASYGRVTSAARSYLGPQQVAVMQSFVEEDLSSRRAYLRWRRAVVEAGGDGSSPVRIIVSSN